MSAADLAGILPELLPKLWVFALRLARDQRDAEDLVHRACARALERTHQMKPGTSPLNWLFSILHTAWISDSRRRRARQHTSDGWDVSFMDTNEDPAGRNAECDMMNRQIVMEVEKLPEAQRAVMLLVAVEGLSYYEAARVLDVPVGTVMSRLSRARRTVEARFAGPDDAPMKANGANNVMGAWTRHPVGGA
ncbi:RNA polymerase sigma-70 factor (ECF subfamily) [Paraburkholderia sp. BL8N3]|nr:RNA polymerase sigma factor [Paraburkholderia sp. BL8N3]TCK34984.1 RNA polymerase sigma-70 factor (ECF subfamily) [Paraburkholderia sp. BL8N3]